MHILKINLIDIKNTVNYNSDVDNVSFIGNGTL